MYERLQAIFTALHLSQEKMTLQKFVDFITLLQKWSKVHNLTALSNTEDILTKHIADSLSIHSYIKGDRIIDVGTGAGFPGIPLALIFPEKSFTLLDSDRKKIGFLIEVKRVLQLPNVRLINQRAEDFHPEALFDIVVTRAVSSLPNIIECTAHLLNPEGVCVAMKAQINESEKKLPVAFQLKEWNPIIVPGLEAERSVAIISHV